MHNVSFHNTSMRQPCSIRFGLRSSCGYQRLKLEIQHVKNIINSTWTTAHVRYIKILTWLRGFRVKITNFSRHPLSRNSQKRLERKENKTNCRKVTRKPGSHVIILKQYIEGGLLTVMVLALTSLTDVNVPTRSALVLETKFASPVAHLNNKNNVCLNSESSYCHSVNRQRMILIY